MGKVRIQNNLNFSLDATETWDKGEIITTITQICSNIKTSTFFIYPIDFMAGI